MRRWWLWVVGGVVFLALSFVALAVLLPPGVPYEFLEGQRELRLPLTVAQKKELDRLGMNYTVYSFKADYKTLKAKADKELKAQGFEGNGMLGATNQVAMYMKGNLMSAMAPAATSGSSARPKRPEMKMVMIHKDTRYTEKSTAPGRSGKDKGWVTVMVMGTRNKTFFDSFRDWIGL